MQKQSGLVKLFGLVFLMAGYVLPVSGQKNSTHKKPNILLICIDDLRPELNCFGASYISSPHIDKLAATGVSFLNHYVNAPSCGPSRYTLLTGQYGPANNDALFIRAKKQKQGHEKIHPSMPEWFRKQGYKTVSVGKVSHHPGGRGGTNWDDNKEIEMPDAWDRHLMPTGAWQHPRGIMHGLAHGEIRTQTQKMDVFQSAEGEDDIYPDGIITREARNQLKSLTADGNQPFFLAIGLIKPHLPFGAPKNYFNRYKDVALPAIPHPQKPTGKTTWHGSAEFKQYNLWGKDPNTDNAFADALRRHYAACVSYADAQVGEIIKELKRTGAYQNTIIVLWGDHGWHLGEHGIWGKHSLFEESLKSPLVISYPGMEKRGLKTNAIVETLDIFPTLCDLAGLEMPGFISGTSLRAVLENKDPKGHAAIAYTAQAKTIRTPTHRLTLHNDNFIELYDWTSPENETKNVAEENQAIVEMLTKMLTAKMTY